MVATATDDELLTLADAALELRTRPHASTLFRWGKRGIRGIKLRLEIEGGRTYTTRAALREFHDAVSAARQAEPPAERSPEMDERLARAGLSGPKKRGRRSTK